MPAGFVSYNSATGSVQIDETYFNLALVAKTDIVSAPSGEGGYRAQVVVDSATPPAVAFRTPGGQRVALQQVTKAGTVWTYDFFTMGSGITITCYLFGLPVYQGGGSGLVVYNSAGQVTFDSRMKYARVHSIISGSLGTVVDAPDVPLPAGRQYAALQALFAGSYELDDPGDGPSGIRTRSRDALGIGFTGDVTADLGPVVIFSLSGPGGSQEISEYHVWPDYKWLILDVTGF